MLTQNRRPVGNREKALQLDQHRDQLLRGYEARAWTADEVKNRSCEEQLGSEHSQEMQ